MEPVFLQSQHHFKQNQPTMNFLRQLFNHNTATPSHRTRPPTHKVNPFINFAPPPVKKQPLGPEKETTRPDLAQLKTQLLVRVEEEVTELSQIDWGQLVGVLKPTEVIRSAIPEEVFTLQLGEGTECPLTNLRHNAIDMLVFQCPSDTQQETLSEIVASNQSRVLLAIENQIPIGRVLQAYEEALKLKCMEKRVLDIQNLLCFRVFQNQNMTFVLLEKKDGLLQKELEERVKRSWIQQSIDLSSITLSEYLIARNHPTDLSLKAPQLQQQSSGEKADPSEPAKTLQPTRISSYIHPTSSTPQPPSQPQQLDAEDEYFASRFTPSSQQQQPEEEPLEQHLQIFYFNEMALDEPVAEDEASDEEEKERIPKRRQRSRSVGSREQASKEETLDDEFFTRY